MAVQDGIVFVTASYVLLECGISIMCCAARPESQSPSAQHADSVPLEPLGPDPGNLYGAATCKVPEDSTAEHGVAEHLIDVRARAEPLVPRSRARAREREGGGGLEDGGAASPRSRVQNPPEGGRRHTGVEDCPNAFRERKRIRAERKTHSGRTSNAFVSPEKKEEELSRSQRKKKNFQGTFRLARRRRSTRSTCSCGLTATVRARTSATRCSPCCAPRPCSRRTSTSTGRVS